MMNLNTMSLPWWWARLTTNTQVQKWRKMKKLLYLDHCLLEEEEEEDDDDLGVLCLKIMAENA
jgi:hypothetical protein